MAQPVLIRNSEELDAAFEASHEQPVFIFKHSLACGASAAAHQTWHRFVEARPAEEGVIYAVVLIQETRDVSDAVARRTGVRHQSPQAILVRHGQPVWNASHWSISEENLQNAVGTITA